MFLRSCSDNCYTRQSHLLLLCSGACFSILGLFSKSWVAVLCYLVGFTLLAASARCMCSKYGRHTEWLQERRMIQQAHIHTPHDPLIPALSLYQMAEERRRARCESCGGIVGPMEGSLCPRCALDLYQQERLTLTLALTLTLTLTLINRKDSGVALGTSAAPRGATGQMKSRI